MTCVCDSSRIGSRDSARIPSTMSQSGTKKHWETVWSQKRSDETSWYQKDAAISLAMIKRSGLAHDDALIDVGGGASVLVGHLLEDGFRDITVLDISAAALQQSQTQLGEDASQINWIEGDVRQFEPSRRYALWHDRAVFHFLTLSSDQRCYIERLERSLVAGGQLIIATFAPGGPEKCSGLEIVRHDADSLQRLLGGAWSLLEQQLDLHLTPAGKQQKFGFYRFEFEGMQH